MSLGFALFAIIGMVFMLGMVVRLATWNRKGVLAFLFAGFGVVMVALLGSTGLYMARSVRMTTSSSNGESTRTISVVTSGLAAPAPPAKPKKAAKPKPPQSARKESAETPPIPPTPSTELAPSAPPVAVLPGTEVPSTLAKTAPAETTPPDAPFTVYLGSSATGRVVESLPEWAKVEAEAAPVSGGTFALSSDRFATVDAANDDLWKRAREIVAGDLQSRVPEATGWRPSTELLRSKGFILERCIERTTLQIGEYVEPMYRVHWRASLSSDLRTAIANEWRPRVQQQRIGVVATLLASATGCLAVLNLLLRGVSSRLAARHKRDATALV